ncbi:hypothetical protein EIP86_011308 [Pleurotus ostreatoroseus]|nr:hypothetical protein EIP86_011308 [Pleurotus ostreatoroseus]
MQRDSVQTISRILDILQSGLPVDADEHTISTKLDEIQVALATLDNIVRISAQPLRDGLASLAPRLWTRVAQERYPCLREHPQPDFDTCYAEAFAAQFRGRKGQTTSFVDASQQTEYDRLSSPPANAAINVPSSEVQPTVLPHPPDHTNHQDHADSRDQFDAQYDNTEPPYTADEEDIGRGYLDTVFGSAGPPYPRAGETVGEFVDRVKRLDFLEALSGKQLIPPHIRARVHCSETARYYILARQLFFHEENIKIHRSFAAAMRAELHKLAGLYAEVSDSDWLLVDPTAHDHEFSDDD